MSEPLVFQTAIASRAKAPIACVIMTISFDKAGEFVLDENGEPVLTPTRLRFDPKIDTMKMARIISEFRGLANAAVTSTNVQISEIDAVIESIDHDIAVAMTGAHKQFRKMLVPPDRAAFDKIAEQVDMITLIRIVQSVMGEMSSMNPTQPVSSGTG